MTEQHRNLGLRESQVLIPRGRENEADGPFPASGDDISNSSDREIWEHFESTKESAIFHLDRYICCRKAWQQLQPVDSSISLVIGK